MPVNIASLGKYLTQELQVHDPVFYDVPEDELWGAGGGEESYYTRIPDLPLGAEEVTSYRRQYVGEGAISDGRAYDIPLADVGIEGSKAKAVLILAGAEWSIADIERAKLANSQKQTPRFNLSEEKVIAVNTAINRRIHRLTYSGSAERGFGGLFNANGVNPVDATGDGNLYGATTPLTPAQLTDWFQGQVATFKTNSKLNYESIVAYVDDDLYTALSKPIADNTGDTPYMRLTSPERGRFLGAIRPITELDPATLEAAGIITNANTRGRMLLGDWTNPRSVRQHYATIDRTDPFLKDSGFHFGITGWAAVSEIIVKVPERFTYINFAHS